MPDYAKKADVIRSGLCIAEKQVSRAFYAQYLLDTTGEYIYSEMDTQRAEELQLFHRMFNLVSSVVFANVSLVKVRVKNRH